MLRSMPDVTTIKVPRALRDRIAAGAASEGVTAAAFLGELLARRDRDDRLAAVGRVYRTERDAEYGRLTQDWDEASDDGLERD
jgi:hypothetical protein